MSDEIAFDGFRNEVRSVAQPVGQGRRVGKEGELVGQAEFQRCLSYCQIWDVVVPLERCAQNGT